MKKYMGATKLSSGDYQLDDGCIIPKKSWEAFLERCRIGGEMRQTPKYKKWRAEQHRKWLLRNYNHRVKQCVSARCVPEEFKSIKITKEALNKANKIARKTIELTGDNEIHMYPLGKKKGVGKNNFAIRDIFIPHEQWVSPVKCVLNSPSAKMKTYEEIRKRGCFPLGWAHSHATMDTFHSPDDDDNLAIKVADGVEKEISFWGDGSDEKFRFKFFPSIVVNAKGHRPSCAIIIEYPYCDPETGKMRRRTYVNKMPELKVVSERNGIDSSDKTIDKEIRERVDYEGKEQDEALRKRYEDAQSAIDEYSELRSRRMAMIRRHRGTITTKNSTILRCLDRKRKRVIEKYHTLIEKYYETMAQYYEGKSEHYDRMSKRHGEKIPKSFELDTEEKNLESKI